MSEQSSNHELPKAYDPSVIEERWAEYWVKERLFDVPTPESTQDGTTKFTILLPPPNVTGRLHMGHMLNQTEMDILTRWHRMLGDLAVWIPGTDHAGIATQMMVERQLASEGTSRKQLGREAFVQRVWCWRKLYGSAILDQMKRLGASVDWDREYFTMDDRLSVAVKEAFIRLYEQGLIYRGAYIVNWDPSIQTAVSDLEVEHEERLGKLYHIRYPLADGSGYITVATTRPETMLGDTAIAVNPTDERYTALIGKKVRVPLTEINGNPAREVPILADDWAKPEFGTGAVKVTPAHDPNDFAIGQRHNLPSPSILDETAHIDLPGSPYDGLDRYAAREKIVADLESRGLLESVKDHTLTIGLSQRTGVVIEPRLSLQWFLAVNKTPNTGAKTIAQNAIEAVESINGEKPAIHFTPEMYKKIYLEWMTNIHDWCISRQLWWGHRIPAWHCKPCGGITVSRDTPKTCGNCNSTDITQETDVLDTWFSSGLLPFTTLGWPDTEPQTTETIRKAAEGEGKYIRQVGGAGNYAHVRLRVSPNEPGKGFAFSNETDRGAVPEKFIQPIRQGIEEAMRGGIVEGHMLVDVKVALVDGSYHEKDSNEMAFRIAASNAFKEAARKAEPTALDPTHLEHSHLRSHGNLLTLDPRTPRLTPDLANFYPTTLLVTGFDILFFWVARMIMLGCHFMLDVPMPDGSKRTLADAVPFKEVYIHGLVRDANREKMSKTKGNVINPIDIIERFGTDAVRFTLASMASPGTDIAFSEARTEGYRAFANKIWNAARFLFMNIDRARDAGITIDLTPDNLREALRNDPVQSTRWIVMRFSNTAQIVHDSLGNYRFDQAADAVYQFFWGDFCDWYIEIAKIRLDYQKESTLDIAKTQTTLIAIFEASLRLLSPFMPFITEELWHALYDGKTPQRSIALSAYPQKDDFVSDWPLDSLAEGTINKVRELITVLRALRKDLGVPEKDLVPISVHMKSDLMEFNPFTVNNDLIQRLARVSSINFEGDPLIGANARSTANFDVAVLYERQIDIPAERERLTKDLAKYEKGLQAAERQLNNEAFMAKAPAPIVEGLRKQYTETKTLYDKTKSALEALGC
jgi:valyl-tRNA synthetase